MYRRGDPRWNRTIQHISENIEHANETAAENIYGFTQSYVNPCFASITNCCNSVTAPCFPSSNDWRRNRARSRGRAELSFDFYDDWEEDENDGLLGWGNDNFERFLGTASNYGATAQPGRQRAMSYGQRARDPRFDTARRKSAVQSREGQDPTLIPSSSYFGFLGRLPFNLGGKGLRYKPSAADLTEHPGALRRSMEEEQPLIEDSGEDDAHEGGDTKTSRRARSNTHTSGHTTDSFSSRGDIFPSEDELDDAVPLDDEFTIALERRTTGQWEDSGKSIAGSGRNTSSKRASTVAAALATVICRRRRHPRHLFSDIPATADPDVLHRSRCASSRTASSGRKSDEDPRLHRAASETIEEVDVPTLDELEQEEERLKADEEAEIQRKRDEARQLAVKRGLAPRDPEPSRRRSRSTNSKPSFEAQMSTVHDTVSPLVMSPASEGIKTPEDIVPFPSFGEYVPESREQEVRQESLSPHGSRPTTAVRIVAQEDFVPARLPHFGASV